MNELSESLLKFAQLGFLQTGGFIIYFFLLPAQLKLGANNNRIKSFFMSFYSFLFSTI